MVGWMYEKLMSERLGNYILIVFTEEKVTVFEGAKRGSYFMGDPVHRTET